MDRVLALLSLDRSTPKGDFDISRRVAPQLGKTTYQSLYRLESRNVSVRAALTAGRHLVLPRFMSSNSHDLAITTFPPTEVADWLLGSQLAEKDVSVLSPWKRDRFGVKPCCGSTTLPRDPILENRNPFLIPFRNRDDSLAVIRLYHTAVRALALRKTLDPGSTFVDPKAWYSQTRLKPLWLSASQRTCSLVLHSVMSRAYPRKLMKLPSG